MNIARYCLDFFATLIQLPHLIGAAIIFVLWWAFWFVIDLRGKWDQFEEPAIPPSRK
jgi:hypothetical protein